MERRLCISSYRNIGFENGKPSQETLTLNHTLEKGKMGDLVILIGANNSGKSNVLDALLAYKNKSLTDRDVTDLYLEEECRKPSLKLECKTEKEQYGFRLFKDGGTKVNCPGMEEKGFEVDKKQISFDRKSLIAELNRIRSLEACYFPSGQRPFTDLIDNARINENTSDKDVEEFLNNYTTLIANYPDPTNGAFICLENQAKSLCPILASVRYQPSMYRRGKGGGDDLGILKQKYKEQFGYDFEPGIYKYEETKIRNADLESTYGNLQNSRFILSVLRSIDVEPTVLINAYNQSVQVRNRGVLSDLEKKLNKNLKKVAEKFNKLYYIEETPYSFEFILESQKIFFILRRGENSITLDYQSAGFQWFFDLYFNLFASNTLKSGDIIIMDEPATNLHVKGQIELRAFLKEFAIKNDITLVLATHSPFLIDLDFLDELRIVISKGNVSSIENDFAAIDPNDPDSLLPVKESLTVENHVIIDPDQNVVFVEGITDYNYLVAMKKVLGYDSLSFLPIKGVGKKGQEKEISEKLIKIRKRNPFLLADGDQAGKAIKNANKDSELKVMLLSEIDPTFKEIENLFDSEDAKKFGLVDEKGKAVKHHSTSSLFKNIVLTDPDSVSNKTKENFKKVFEAIID